MQITVAIPKAFSALNENEFVPIQHLVARLHPQLVVKQVASAVRVDGGGTVLWGMVCLEGQPLHKQDVETALREAGFDFEHSVLAEAENLWVSLPGEGSVESNL